MNLANFEAVCFKVSLPKACLLSIGEIFADITTGQKLSVKLRSFYA